MDEESTKTQENTVNPEILKDNRKIIEILLKNKKLVTPKALELIKEKNLLDKVLKTDKKIIDETVLKSLEEPEIRIERNRKKKLAEEYSVDFKLENIKIAHKERKASDFISYFNSKFSKVQQMLAKRVNPISISNIKKTNDNEVSLIGMVSDKRTTAAGNKIIELEDPTGIITCMATKNSKTEVFDEFDNILSDEVLGIKGYFKNNYVFINEIIRPDIPITNTMKKIDAPISCVFISDLHVGSVDFLGDLFSKFIKWLNSKDAETVKYLFIAGDLVDGIGIYLNQEADLSIKSIHKQYEYTAKLLSEIPEHIKIIVQPGNHDIVGNQEPQQPLSETALSKLSNIEFGTTPCSIIINNTFRILMYHGYSYDYLIREIPGIRQDGYRKPYLPMLEVLKRRHFVSTHGSSLVIPELVDSMVIDKIPDIFHSGHLHTVALENYKNVLIINSGTFQGRTQFQEMQGHIPHPGIFAHVNLQTRDSKLINLNDIKI
ncbi:MAG: DNA-directed DNA polymerase II small subunit [Candidatus Aenigmarchaeota archaeon]|nr:DNA-directed DNA polymerase II small subunit [Candidatus Aenigmarchaeota archaeon]